MSIIAKKTKKKCCCSKRGIIAAVLNILVTGLGYVYLKKRIEFGALLIISEIGAVLWVLSNPGINDLTATATGQPLLVISTIAFLGALAYDAYREAES